MGVSNSKTAPVPLYYGAERIPSDSDTNLYSTPMGWLYGCHEAKEEEVAMGEPNRKQQWVPIDTYHEMVRGRARAEHLALALAKCIQVHLSSEGSLDAAVGLANVRLSLDVPDWQAQVQKLKERL